MEYLRIEDRLKEIFPEEVISVDEFREQISVVIRKNRVLDICRTLHEEPEFRFDYLQDLCGVDYMGKKDVRFEVVYQLYSHKNDHKLRLRAEVPEDDCTIQSVTSIWNSADWNERECYDMFGIEFRGHPDLRRILLPEDWEGYPLRKDYPITGPGPDREWSGFKEVLEKSEEFKQYEWNR